jgi:hypothetical protein
MKIQTRGVIAVLAALGAATVQAQYATGSGFGGGGLSGVSGGYGSGAVIARVNVAPVAGGFGFQAGGQGLQGGGAGLQAGGLGSQGGGLHGVTRPTFMGEANAVAAQFFESAGVTGLAQTTAAAGGAPGAGRYFGQRQAIANPINRTAGVARPAGVQNAAVAWGKPSAPQRTGVNSRQSRTSQLAAAVEASLQPAAPNTSLARSPQPKTGTRLRGWAAVR